jgi:AcrR family transcriptional regulator
VSDSERTGRILDGMSTVAPASKDTKAVRTRRRIVDAAAVEFAAYGYTATSLRRVAAASGLKLGSL